MLCLILTLVAAASAFPKNPVPALFEPIPRELIVNGEIAQQHAWPWQLSLRTTGHICGAIITDATWVTTAAHCVNNFGYEVVAGAHERNCDDCTGAEQVIEVANVYQHPDFIQDGSIGFPNDIALLELASPIDVSGNTASTIQIASGNTDFAGQDCTITGWGDTTAGGGVSATFLKQATLPILSPDVCQAAWGQADAALHICIFDVDNGAQGSCQGDSGGPMNCQEGGSYVAAGVTSWGVVGCLGMPSVYVRTSTYRQWLCSTSGGRVGC
ncbi:unnamed protein product [Owenia fusiformis]|uniref:Peptidase S1 domain-containing protein n=1 Tax=Owenia fusiformis TaxID=6347 RepID=A0A8S4QFM1_OWEFU|nr:unnamed protein product [Owenia fusiformis]